ncbi:MAG TPA: hypothetical protein VES20_23610 [Bryobacteraceae bacterium]|nr:hypothetical protein [Bryobacteraceae bacterium]
MPLFTDGPPATLTDLREYESGVLALASSEGVDLTAKLRVSQRELGCQIAAFLVSKGYKQAERDLSIVAVTEPMLHAHTLRTLEIAYRDIYQSQLNDRYQGKWQAYRSLAEEAFRQLMRVGIPIVANPLPRPATPSIEAVPGGLLPSRTLHVRVGLVNVDNRCGALSGLEMVQIEPGARARVSLRDIPSEAIGWLLYAGTSEDSCSLQTVSPLAKDASWTEPTAGLLSGVEPWPSIEPYRLVRDDQKIQRG